MIAATSLEYAWLVLTCLHGTLVIGYFWYVRRAARTYPRNDLSVKGAEPTVSIIVPARDEALTLSKRIENLRQLDYPLHKMEFVLVNHGSLDSTQVKLREAAKLLPQGKVLDVDRKLGKGQALNLALTQTSGEFVGVADADCTWHRSAVRAAIRRFEDPLVGAVTGTEVAIGECGGVLTSTEPTYRSIYHLLRVGESEIHSTPIFDGGLCFFRHSVLDKFEDEIGADDTGTALRVIKKGYRAVISPEAWFFETVPKDSKVWAEQKLRRAQHLVQAFLRYRDLIVRSSSRFDEIVFPFEFYLHVIGPSVVMIIIIGYLLLAASVEPLMIGFLAPLIVPRIFRMTWMYVTTNVLLVAGLVREIFGSKYLRWATRRSTYRNEPQGRL